MSSTVETNEILDSEEYSLDKFIAEFEIEGFTAIKALAVSKNFDLEDPKNISLIENSEKQILNSAKLMRKHIGFNSRVVEFKEEVIKILRDWISSGMDRYSLTIKIHYLITFYKEVLETIQEKESNE